ncbi:MAG: hypothetical protein WAU72_01685 [Acidimicrobiia bacterium]
MQTIDISQSVISTKPNTFTFLLRDDTVEVVEDFEKRAIALGHNFSDEMRSQLHLAYQEFMEGLIKVYKDNSDVRNTIIEVVEASVVNKIRNQKIADFISTCDDECVVVTMDPLCNFPDTIPFAVSRLFNSTGSVSTKLTNRPGSVPIFEQIDAIRTASRGKKIILVEDDLFSGSTINRTMALFRGDAANGGEIEIDVAAVFLGIQVITDVPLAFGDEIHVDPVYSVYIPAGCKIDDLVNVGDPRDFLVGGDGLVTEVGRMPYVRPFISPNARASVPHDREIIFSLEVLRLTKRFYSVAEETTGVLWPANICEPAASNGLIHHGFVEQDRTHDTSMTDVIEKIQRHPLLELNNPEPALSDF